METSKGFNTFRSHYEQQLLEALAGVDPQQVERARALIRECAGTIWLIGNGGLASLAEHMAVDLQLAGKRAQALTQSAAVTTYANDIQWAACFEAQLVAMVRDGDIIITMSGSGNSSNILSAVDRMWCEVAKHGVPIVGISSSKGRLIEKVSHPIALPTIHIGIAQDLIQILLHEITYEMMEGE